MEEEEEEEQPSEEEEEPGKEEEKEPEKSTKATSREDEVFEQIELPCKKKITGVPPNIPGIVHFLVVCPASSGYEEIDDFFHDAKSKRSTCQQFVEAMHASKRFPKTYDEVQEELRRPGDGDPLVFARLTAYPHVQILVLISETCRRFRDSRRRTWKGNVHDFAETLTVRYREREEAALPWEERRRRYLERHRAEDERRERESKSRPREPEPTYFTQLPVTCQDKFPDGITHILEVCDARAGYEVFGYVKSSPLAMCKQALSAIGVKGKPNKANFIFGRAHNGDHILAYFRKGECRHPARRSESLTALQNVEWFAEFIER